MKVSIVKCKKCNRVVAGCNIDDGTPASWYRALAKYSSKGIFTIEEKESDGNIFEGIPLNKCCGNKKYHV